MILSLAGLIAYIASRNGALRAFAMRVGQSTSEAGLTLIRQFEGFESKAYKDIAGHWTIGFGIKLPINSPLINSSVTPAQAAQMLKDYVNKSVDPIISRFVKVPLNQNQYDALASWLYNLGEDNFRTSTLLKKLNAGDYYGAANEFPRWNKATVNGVLREVGGLTSRRAAERELFLA